MMNMAGEQISTRARDRVKVTFRREGPDRFYIFSLGAVRISCNRYHWYAPYRPMPSQANIPTAKRRKESRTVESPMTMKNQASQMVPATSFATVPPRVDCPRSVFWRMADSMSQTPPPKAGKRRTAAMR